MAEIKMSYIFIEKQKNESKAMQEILLEVIDDIRPCIKREWSCQNLQTS